MNHFSLSLDVAKIRDDNAGNFGSPEIHLNLVETEFSITLTNIPRDLTSNLQDLQNENYQLQDKIHDLPAQADVDFWKNRCIEAERQVAQLVAEKQLTPEILDIVRAHFGSNGFGNKINAIKGIREKTRMGLKEAKDVMDAAWAKLAAEKVEAMIPLDAPAPAVQ